MLSVQMKDVLAARTTWCLAVLLVGIHLTVVLSGGPDEVSSWYLTLGLSRERLFQGELWQLVTHGLLHGDWLHLGLNVFALLAVGARLEKVGGRTLLFRVVFAGLLGGGLAHVLLSGSETQCLVGISGVVFAAILCLTGISPESRMWPLPLSGRSFGLGVLLTSGILASLNPRLGLGDWSEWGRHLNDLGGGWVFTTSHACHLGGAMAGVLCARWVLRPRVSLARLQADRRRREGRLG